MPAPQLYLWPNRALVVGVSSDSQMHAHFAMQISYGLNEPFYVRENVDCAWQATRAALFAPHRSHQIDSKGSLLAHLFIVLPSMPKATAQNLTSQLLADFQHHANFPSIATQLQQLAVMEQIRQPEQADAVAVAKQVLQHWLDCALPDFLDPTTSLGACVNSPKLHSRAQARMQIIFDYIHRHMQNHSCSAPNAQELADLVHLSSSRFLHFFREQAGMSLARYVLWVRLQMAIQAISQGASITTAAHLAGFADLAHMSRSFRATIGIPASSLQKFQIFTAQS